MRRERICNLSRLIHTKLENFVNSILAPEWYKSPCRKNRHKSVNDNTF